MTTLRSLIMHNIHLLSVYGVHGQLIKGVLPASDPTLFAIAKDNSGTCIKISRYYYYTILQTDFMGSAKAPGYETPDIV